MLTPAFWCTVSLNSLPHTPPHPPFFARWQWLLICALVLLTYAAYAQGTHPNVTVPRMLVSAASLAASMWFLLWLL